MKSRLVFLVVLAFFTQATFAQVIGVKGGVNIANVSFSEDGMDISPNSIMGIHVGLVADFESNEHFGFNTGVLYSIKGYSFEFGDDDFAAKINYLEVPLNFAYKISFGESFKFIIQAGPYLGYALNGKSKYGDMEEDIEFGEDEMKNIDYGLGFGPGIELGPIVASLNYQLGLANLIDGSDENIKNKVFQISIAYMFGK